MFDDGLAYVKNADDPTGLDGNGEPKSKDKAGQVEVRKEDVDAVIEAAEECPGECIFIEEDDRAPYHSKRSE